MSPRELLVWLPDNLFLAAHPSTSLHCKFLFTLPRVDSKHDSLLDEFTGLAKGWTNDPESNESRFKIVL